MKLSNFQPLGNLVLIEKIEPAQGKILMTDSMKSPPNQAWVSRLGTGWKTMDGEDIPFHVAERDKIMFVPFNTRKVTLETEDGEKEFILISHADILAVEVQTEDGPRWEAVNNYVYVIPFVRPKSQIAKLASVETPQRWGRATSVGPGVPDMRGSLVRLPIKVGNAVAVDAHGREFIASTNIEGEDETPFFVSEYDILLKADIED